MGIDLLIADVAFPFRRGPDWAAARRAIGALQPGRIDTGWFDRFETEGSHELDMQRLRKQLTDDLSTFTSVLAGDPHSDLDVVHTREHCYMVTGGLSAGEEPTWLCYPLWNLATAGILQAAGSVAWTAMEEVDFPPPAGGPDRPWEAPAASSHSRGFSWFVAEQPPDWESALQVAGRALEEDLKRVREETMASYSRLSTSVRVGKATIWLFGRLRLLLRWWLSDKCFGGLRAGS